jgi:hypothetical protein
MRILSQEVKGAASVESIHTAPAKIRQKKEYKNMNKITKPEETERKSEQIVDEIGRRQQQKRTCMDCSHFLPDRKDGDVIGACRRHAPLQLLYREGELTTPVGGISAEVGPETWCGDFSPKVELESCEHCRHFEAHPDPDKFIGSCLCGHPSPFLWADGEPMKDRETIWPIVEEGNRCGSFSLKPRG